MHELMINPSGQSVEFTNAMRASHGKRFLNYLIDYGIQLVIVFFLAMFAVLLYEFLDYGDFTLWLENLSKIQEIVFGWVVLVVYYTAVETFTKGRSIGKFVTRTKVIRIDGEPLQLKDLVIRSLSRLIPFDPLSFLGNKASGWHDTISKTTVVDIKKYEEEKFKQTAIEKIGKEEIV